MRSDQNRKGDLFRQFPNGFSGIFLNTERTAADFCGGGKDGSRLIRRTALWDFSLSSARTDI